uniref:C-type lectin domain-containing protein n=1 Tax=Panagrolaimus sp. ES5 TaxID=591445 RepID=A0AC34FSW1_9BILA
MEEPSGCPNGWIYNGKTGYCYFVREEVASWEENENWCFSQGAHLASVHSDDENNFITSLINFSIRYICGRDQLAWIGLYTVTNQTTWRWTDNSPYDYHAWATCKPDNAYRGANCALIQNPENPLTEMSAKFVAIVCLLIVAFASIEARWKDHECSLKKVETCGFEYQVRAAYICEPYGFKKSAECANLESKCCDNGGCSDCDFAACCSDKRVKKHG